MKQTPTTLLRPLFATRCAARLATLALPLSLLCSACGTPDDDKKEPVGAGTGDPTGPAAGEAWKGKTYLLRTTAGDWVTPRGIGQDIGPYVPGFLLRVDEATGTDVTVTIGTVPAAVGSDVQDPCTATQTVVAQSAAYPDIAIGPIDFTTYLVNAEYAVNAHISGLSFSNVLPNGTDETEGTLTATLDFREVAHLLTLLVTPDPNSACAALEQRNATCAACPDGQPYCLTIVASPVTATEYAGTAMDIPSATCPDKLREVTEPAAAPSTPAPAATP